MISLLDKTLISGKHMYRHQFHGSIISSFQDIGTSMTSSDVSRHVHLNVESSVLNIRKLKTYSTDTGFMLQNFSGFELMAKVCFFSNGGTNFHFYGLVRCSLYSLTMKI